MADMIERLYKLTVDGTQASRQLADIARATDNLDRRLASSIDSLKKWGTAIAGVASAGAIIHGFQQIVEGFDQIGKDAAKVGVAAEELQRLRYAADLAGVGSEQLDTAIKKVAVGMGDLADGTSDTAKALRAIGASGGDSATEVLKKAADAFAKMPDGMAKTTLAVQLFGKAVGPDLIPLLNGGREELEALTAQADEFGFVVSDSVIAAAEEFNDNLSRLQKTAAGVGAQLAAGMLPALQTLAESLLGAAKQGDGFVSTGAKIGEMLLNLYGFGLKAAATIEAFGKVIGAVAAVMTSTGDQPMTIWADLRDDINNLERDTNDKLASVRDNFKKFTEAAAAPAEPVKKTTAAIRGLVEATDAQAKASKDAAKALEEQERRRMSIAKILIEIEERDAQVKKDLADQEERHRKEAEAATKAQEDLIRSLDPAAAAAEDYAAKLQQIDDLYFSGVTSAEQYERMMAQLNGTFDKVKPPAQVKTALDMVQDGFEGFFQTLASGSADAEDAFKRMTQSILASLLRLLAKKAIFAAFGIDIGGPGSVNATGGVFDSGRIIPFASGGIISRPITFPMALAGEAGPEAILPLRRTPSGDLGVQATQPLVNVQVVNNASNVVGVSVNQRGSDLQILVDHTRAAIASDIRTGGTAVSRSLESAYGIGRGAAAPF